MRWHPIFLHLHFLHLIKEPFLFHQLFIGSEFSHAAVINDSNPISTSNRGEPVGYDQCGTVLRQIVGRFLNLLFRDGIER